MTEVPQNEFKDILSLKWCHSSVKKRKTCGSCIKTALKQNIKLKVSCVEGKLFENINEVSLPGVNLG